jgi:hypothetical protein
MRNEREPLRAGPARLGLAVRAEIRSSETFYSSCWLQAISVVPGSWPALRGVSMARACGYAGAGGSPSESMYASHTDRVRSRSTAMRCASTSRSSREMVHSRL